MIKVIIAGFLATVSAVLAQTQIPVSRGITYHATPSAVMVYPGDFKNAGGAALALGATINEVHSVEAEAISFNTNNPGGGDDYRFTPVLLTYKYNFVFGGKFSAVAGGSVGATFEKWDFFVPSTYNSGSPGYYYSVSQTAFTSGLVGGVSYAISSRVSVDANAHVLRLEKSDVTTAGNMVLVSLGIKVRF
jgi:opacity protein-like surface antigen